MWRTHGSSRGALALASRRSARTRRLSRCAFATAAETCWSEPVPFASARLARAAVAWAVRFSISRRFLPPRPDHLPPPRRPAPLRTLRFLEFPMVSAERQLPRGGSCAPCTPCAAARRHDCSCTQSFGFRSRAEPCGTRLRGRGENARPWIPSPWALTARGPGFGRFCAGMSLPNMDFAAEAKSIFLANHATIAKTTSQVHGPEHPAGRERGWGSSCPKALTLNAPNCSVGVPENHST